MTESNEDFVSDLGKVKFQGGLKGLLKGAIVGTALTGTVAGLNYLVNENFFNSPFDLPFYVFESTLFLTSCTFGLFNGIRKSQKEYLQVLSYNADRASGFREYVKNSKILEEKVE